MTTLVKYIGKRPTYREGTYSSGVIWTQGETKAVPDDLAAKLLKHVDVYAPGDKKATETVTLPEKEVDEQAEKTDDMLLQIRQMDKDALAIFAKTHFNVTLDKRRAADALRQEVTTMFDRFGVE